MVLGGHCRDCNKTFFHKNESFNPQSMKKKLSLKNVRAVFLNERGRRIKAEGQESLLSHGLKPRRVSTVDAAARKKKAGDVQRFRVCYTLVD